MLLKLLMEMIKGNDKSNTLIPQIIEEDVFTVSDYLIDIGDLIKDIVQDRGIELNKSLSYLARSRMFRVEDSIYVYVCKITNWKTVTEVQVSNADKYYSYTLEEFYKMYDLNDSYISKFNDLADGMLALADHSVEYTYKVLHSINKYGSNHFIGVGSRKFNEAVLELQEDFFKTKRNTSIYFAVLNNINSFKIKELMKMAKVTEIMDDHIYEKVEIANSRNLEFKNVVNAMVILKMLMKLSRTEGELMCKFDNSLRFNISRYSNNNTLHIRDDENSCVDKVSFDFNPDSDDDIEKAVEAYARYYLAITDMEIESSINLSNYGIYVVKCKYGNILGKTYSFFHDYAYDYVRPNMLKLISDDLMNLISIELKE